MTRQLILARRIVDGNGTALDGGAVLITDGLVEAVGPAAVVGRPEASTSSTSGTAPCSPV